MKIAYNGMGIFEKYGEWSGYTVRESKKGFIVHLTSRIQGESSGVVYLLKFDNELKPGQDLMTEYNDYHTYGEIIAELAKEGGMILSRGLIVQ